MEWGEAISGLIGEIDSRASVRSASRFMPAPPQRPEGQSELDAQAEIAEESSAVRPQKSSGESLSLSAVPTTADRDLPSPAVPQQAPAENLQIPQPIGQDWPDVETAAPPAVSHSDLSVSTPPTSPEVQLETASPQSAEMADLPVSDPPPVSEPGPTASAPPVVATSSDVTLPEPSPPASDDELHVQLPQAAPDRELSLSQPPAMASSDLPLPSRYATPDAPLPVPQVSEETLPPLQAQFPVAPQSGGDSTIDEPDMFPPGFDVPRFAEMVSDVAAFKMAQREADLFSRVQDELAVALSAVDRRFAL